MPLFSLIYGIAFWLGMLFSMSLFIPLYLLRWLNFQAEANFYLGRIGRYVTRTILFSTGTRLYVEGLENIPRHQPHCYIGNHQAYADILSLMSAIPEPAGFIAKSSLKKVPAIRSWMIHLGCYFLKRDSLKDGMRAILFGVERVRKGYAMVIFPEGRRSKGPQMLPFRKGGIKLATKAKAWTVPVSIYGSYRILEKYGHPCPTWIGVRFHPPIATAQLSPAEEEALPDQLWQQIQDGVTALKSLSPRR